MANLSYQEKGLYAQGVCLVALTAFYIHGLVYSHVGRFWLHGAFLVLLLALTVFRWALRRSSGSTVIDERDREIRGLGARWSNVLLFGGIIVILVLYYDHGALKSSAELIGLLFHLLIFAGAISIVRQLVAYRRLS